MSRRTPSAKVIKSSETKYLSASVYQRNALEGMSEADIEFADPESTDPDDILAMARTEAERVVQEAYAEGLRRGIEAGKAEYLRTMGQSAEAVHTAAEAVQQVREAFLESLEPQVLALVHAIAERILQREIRTDPELVRTTIRSALANLTERERIVVRLNPQDLVALRQHTDDPLSDFQGAASLEVVSDDSVSSGGCVAETDTAYVDAQLESQLKTILEALAP